MTEPPYPGDQPIRPAEPAVPGSGWTVPPPPPSGDPDPLVGTPDGGFEGWIRRTIALCRRSFGPALAIGAAAYLVPSLVTSGIAAVITHRLNAIAIPTQADPDNPFGPLKQMAHSVAGWYALLLVVAVAVGYVQSVAWASITRLMARDALGHPRDLGATIRFGLRRGLPLWGWYVVVYLCVVVGACFCVVPGVYLALAMSLIAPIVVFERQQPAITRSFRLMHSNFWPSVGRLLLLGLCYWVYALIVGTILGAVTGVSTMTFTAGLQGQGHVPESSLAAQLLVGVLDTIVTLPATIVGIAGILALYAELRAREGEQATGADLAAAAG